MESYKSIAQQLFINGDWKPNRTGIDTLWFPGVHWRHNMSNGFPVPTTKKLAHRVAAVELEGFVGGITDKEWYQNRKCNIWNEWCNPEALQQWVRDLQQTQHISVTKEVLLRLQKECIDLGPIYGYQWRRFGQPYLTRDNINTEKKFEPLDQPMDQLNTLVDTLKCNPLDRRMMVTAWNPLQLHQMALPPCHLFFQCMSDGKNLDLQWYQRSVDTVLGLPFDIFHYGMMLTLLAKTTGLKPRWLIGSFGDFHIYRNHVDKFKMQLQRTTAPLPRVEILNNKTLFDWTHEDYVLHDYTHHSSIKYEVAI